MKKIFKKMTAIAIATAITTGLCIGISANSVTDSKGYGNFEWTSSYAKTTNITNNSRRVSAVINIFEDNTGRPVGGSLTDSDYGTYGTYAIAKNTQYSSSKYNFQMYGEVYSSPAYQSPIVWYTGIKYVD